MVLVTGANGNLGRLVIDNLKNRIPFSELAVSVREPEKARDLVARGIEVRKANFQDPASVVDAFTGIDTVLIISTRGGADVVSEHRNAIDAAVKAGVRRIVYTSGTKENISNIGRVHEQTEEYIKKSRLVYTILRNNLYAEVLVREMLSALRTGVLSSPVGEGEVAAVPRSDCAIVAAIVLTTTGHENSIYDVTGQDRISWKDLAETASRVTGKNIVYRPATSDQYKDAMKAAGQPESLIDFLLENYKAYSSNAYNGVSDTVAKLSGFSQLSVMQFLENSLNASIKGPSTAAMRA